MKTKTVLQIAYLAVIAALIAYGFVTLKEGAFVGVTVFAAVGAVGYWIAEAFQ